MSVQSKMVGPNFSREITDFLYFNKTSNTSSDLVAKNLQRGRDHGIPGPEILHIFARVIFQNV